MGWISQLHRLAYDVVDKCVKALCLPGFIIGRIMNGSNYYCVLKNQMIY
jgi:hypothetical protein